MCNQTGRNIRKVRATILKKLRKPLYAFLKDPSRLTKREFMALYEATGGGKRDKHEDAV